jgi:hypothetical protein
MMNLYNSIYDIPLKTDQPNAKYIPKHSQKVKNKKRKKKGKK